MSGSAGLNSPMAYKQLVGMIPGKIPATKAMGAYLKDGSPYFPPLLSEEDEDR